MTGQIQPRPMAPITRPMTAPMLPMLAQPSLTPREIIGFLRRHIWMIVILTVVGGILGTVSFVVLRRLRPQYVAESFIRVLPQGEKDPLIIGDQQLNKDIQYQFRNSKAAMLRDPGLLKDLLANDAIRKTVWFRRFKTPLLDRMLGRIADENKPDNEKAITKALKDLKKNFIASPQRENEFIVVAMKCFGANAQKECVQILRALIELYMKSQKDSATSDLAERKRELVNQQNVLKRNLDTANSALDTIRQASKDTAYGNLTTIRFRDYIEEKLAALETQSTALESEITRLTSEVKFLKARAEGDYDEVIREQIELDSISASLRRQLSQLEMSLAGQLATFGEGHRRVKETRDAIAQTQNDLSKRQTEIGDLVRKSQQILADENLKSRTLEMEQRTKQLMAGRDEYRALGAIRAQYEAAEAVRDEARTQLENMKAHIEKVTVMIEDPDLPRVKFGGSITDPREPSAPKWYTHIFGGLFLGLALSLAITFALEMFSTLLRTPTDVMRTLHAPLLGTICHEQADDETEGVDLFHVVRQAPYSIMSENYRQFRTNLRLSESGANKKILLITSPAAGDGKTTVAVNMASTLVAENHRILYIDANFRRPISSKVFARTAEGNDASHADYGLSNYLLGQCSDPRDIVRSSGMEGLDIIDSGPLPPNPAESLGSTTMKNLLNAFRDSYDYILIDGPALLVSDAKALAALADGTLVVFNATHTRKGEAQRALRELKDIQASVIGTVLLGVETLRGGYFGELYRAYQQYQQVPQPRKA